MSFELICYRTVDQLHELGGHDLSPKSFFAFAIGRDESHVPALLGREQHYVGVSFDVRVAERLERNERVILRVNEERGKEAARIPVDV